MQEIKLQYGQNKGKQYNEEEDRFLLVRMHHHGIDREDCYELVKRDIGEWPLFRQVLPLSTRKLTLADSISSSEAAQVTSFVAEVTLSSFAFRRSPKKTPRPRRARRAR